MRSLESLHRPQTDQLQRGRARAGAEWISARVISPHFLSFNGAAPARARNVDCPLPPNFNGWLLQRGRARAGAE